MAGVEPSKRFFTTRQMSVAQAGIVTLGLGQVYISLGDAHDGAIDARMFWKPLVALIWFGAVVMAMGAALSLSDRRLRIGVALRSRRLTVPVSDARRMTMRRLLLVLVLLLGPVAARAVQPDEILPDPVLEGRARTISEGLRCLVCQNQSIDDSAAPLARDLRLLVRDRLKAGDTDQAVREYLVARYGDFVLLKPRSSPPPRCCGRRRSSCWWPVRSRSCCGGARRRFRLRRSARRNGQGLRR